jgi:hypothetical protein
MLLAPRPQDPIVLSYLALRKAFGAVALGLPFALSIPLWILRHHIIQSSISGYYYTGMRNLSVGSLCAIGMFMLCCRGYDLKDEIAGVFSAFCTLGVAFFPSPRIAAQRPAKATLGLHITSLPFFCFRRSPISVLCFSR